MQLKEIENKLEKIKQNLYELGYKKKTAEKQMASIKKELGDVSMEELLASEKGLDQEMVNLEKKVDVIFAEVEGCE